MEVEKNRHNLRSSWLAYFTKCLPISSTSPSSPSPENEYKLTNDKLTDVMKTTQRKPAGWRSMPYVLGNETFEKLATFGLSANFMIFLLTVFHMDQVSASYVLYIWGGVGNYAPLLGAFISDAYVGRFTTIAFSSFASLLGMVTLTLIAWLPQLHPPSCPQQQSHPNQCQGPTTSQMGILVLALGFLSIGTGGISPCSLPFGVDQFDAKTEEGRKGINSFFNIYYTIYFVLLIIALTVVVYVQDSIGWVWGFSIPILLMVGSIVLFFVGTKLYVYVKPEGSVFSGIAQALVVAYRKRKTKLPPEGEVAGVFYDPPVKDTVLTKLSLTNQFRFLNKAAFIMEGDVNPDGTRADKWRLCSIQQIEELKCLLRVIPVWASGIVFFTALGQQGTFTISQALKTDRHLGPHFQIPPGSIAVILMITLGIWLPVYDRVIVPPLRKITKLEGGITLLQRIGIGIVFSLVSMVVSGLVETMRRDSALRHARPDGIAPITVMWLAPQFILMGFAEAFNVIGQIEFYNKEFPEHMRSVANSMIYCASGSAGYLSSLLVSIVHKYTAKNGHPDWLTKDINQGKVDYLYYLLAGMVFLNFVYFLVVANSYQYKTRMRIDEEEPHLDHDVELNAIKY